MNWILLVLAGLLEVGWAIGLKYTDGFRRTVPTVLTLLSMGASIGLLGMAVRTLPIGTAYAVWTGIGAAGTVIAGMILLGEPVNTGRVVCVALILCGIVGLKLQAN
jgi:quaternary ammonium compound-resistance protein SugE